ncbi:MAG: hypothetical protein KJ674_04100 [Nanoarchaeota archaeon]|nr:hypothetical protein [Nanoarchaeota archaeon]
MKKKSKEKTSCGVKENCGGFLYCLGFIGAAVYNVSVATGFWNGVWGVIKALVWPAFLVYNMMQLLGV